MMVRTGAKPLFLLFRNSGYGFRGLVAGALFQLFLHQYRL